MENLYLDSTHRRAMEVLSERPLTKLDALRILSNAYWHLNAYWYPEAKFDSQFILVDKFGYVRRSMTLEDLKPQEHYVTNEGYNGKMPQYF